MFQLNWLKFAVVFSCFVNGTLAQALPADARSTAPVQSVCEILGNLRAYAGKSVVVRGQFVANREAHYLVDLRCNDAIREGPRTWPAAISVVSVGSNANGAAKSAADALSLQRMWKILAFLHESTTSALGVEVTVTLVGELKTVYSSESGAERQTLSTPRLSGFGHANTFPAELVYKSASDIVVKELAQ